jgi:hypothetical protein
MPTPNQVVNELNQANENFDILANAFQGGNPATGVVLNAVNSQNAINSQNAQNSDTVDGFHVSLTPAPNVIVPLDANGILDLSATYVKSNVYTFRRVDLANATSDYELQVGEEAIIYFTNKTSVPLRIATGSNRLYEIFLQFFNNYADSNVYIYFNPNNTTYASSFSSVGVQWNSTGGSGFSASTATDNAFRLFFGTPYSYIVLDTSRRIMRGFLAFEWTSYPNHTGVGIFASRWYTNLSVWSSLGTFVFPVSMSGYILVRRLA